MKVDKGVCTNDADDGGDGINSGDCSGTNTPRLLLDTDATDENFYRGTATVAQRYGVVFSTLLENKILSIKREAAVADAEQRKRKQKFRRKKFKSPEAIDVEEHGGEIVLDSGGRLKEARGRGGGGGGKRGIFCIKRNSMTETDLVTIATTVTGTRKCDENMHSNGGGGNDPSTIHIQSPPHSPASQLPALHITTQQQHHVTYEPTTICELNIMLNEHQKNQRLQYELEERCIVGGDDVDIKNSGGKVVEAETMVDDNKANINDSTRRYHHPQPSTSPSPPPLLPSSSSSSQIRAAHSIAPPIEDEILQDVLVIRSAIAGASSHSTKNTDSLQSLHSDRSRKITFKRNDTTETTMPELSSSHSSTFGGIYDDIRTDEFDLPITPKPRKSSTTETTFSYPSSMQAKPLQIDFHSPRMLLDHERHRLRLLEAKSISAQCSPIFSRALRSCSTQSEMIDASQTMATSVPLRLLHRQYTSDDSAGAMTCSSTVDEEQEEPMAMVTANVQSPLAQPSSSSIVTSKLSNKNKHDKVDRTKLMMMMMTSMAMDRRQNVDSSSLAAATATQGFISNFNQITSNNINLNLPVITTTSKKRSCTSKSDKQPGGRNNCGSRNYGQDTSADGSMTQNIDEDGLKRYRKKCSEFMFAQHNCFLFFPI